MTIQIYMMMRRALLIIFCISCCANASDSAVTETARRLGYTVAELQEFLKNCDRDQYSMNMCAVYKFVAEDIKLNKLYERQLALLKEDTDEAESLKKAQKSWVRFRDLDCEYIASGAGGGSIGIMLIQNCKRERTIERIRHIESYLKCNSPGCPGDW